MLTLERPLDGFHTEIAGATALVHEALGCHLERHPGDEPDGGVVESAEAHARMLVEVHGGAPRLSEFLTGSHLTFLGAAVEASGVLAHAEIALAAMPATGSEPVRRARQRGIALRAEQVRSALVAALGGLLAYSELAAARRPPAHDQRPGAAQAATNDSRFSSTPSISSLNESANFCTPSRSSVSVTSS